MMDILGLAALVFVLGLKHGLDPDHLVAIDGFTRSSNRAEMRRWCGLFFSLGHGAVVTLVGVYLARVPAYDAQDFQALERSSFAPILKDLTFRWHAGEWIVERLAPCVKVFDTGRPHPWPRNAVTRPS